MTDGDTLRTARLTMRRWREADRAPFAALNADPEVMRYFPGVLSRAESDAMIDRIEKHFETHGYGLWAIDAPEGFIGFVGLAWVRFEEHFTPALEVGWRLARHGWGHGYATEAGHEALRIAWERTDLGEIVSITTHANEPSQRVMRRLGLTRNPADDFRHPALPDGHPLTPHVLYRISRDRISPGRSAGPVPAP